MSVTSLDSSALEKMISAAIAAPSMHNTQPWHFRFDPELLTLEIHAAAERGLPSEDPHGRALHIAAGAALVNLRIAVTYLGWKPVARLLPDAHRPDLLVTVRITPRAGLATVHGPDLYDAIWRRRSSRFPFAERRVPTAVMQELAEAAHMEGAALTVPDPHETDRLLRVTATAERRNHADPDRSVESRRWTGRDAGEDTGIPSSAFGPQDAFEQVPMRDFGARRSLEQLPSRPFERTPTVAVLTTAHDRRMDWLRAGQALQSVLLVATAQGLRTSLLHQALEWPDLRDLLRPETAPFDHVQLLVRLGYGPDGPATPRRAPHLLLDPEEADPSDRR